MSDHHLNAVHVLPESVVARVSTDHEHHVVTLAGSQLAYEAHCTCPANAAGRLCSHVLTVLQHEGWPSPIAAGQEALELEEKIVDLGAPEGGRYWRVVSDHPIDHPDVQSAAVHARVTGSVGCTYNEAKVERADPARSVALDDPRGERDR